jgi:hypothetical protein
MVDPKVIDDLFSQDIDDIYAEVGSQLVGEQMFTLPRERLIEIAQRWLGDQRSQIAEKVCPSDIVLLLTSEDPTTQNRILLVTSIADLISSLVFTVSPVTVSVLVIKEGLSLLCKGIWKSKQ